MRTQCKKEGFGWKCWWLRLDGIFVVGFHSEAEARKAAMNIQQALDAAEQPKARLAVAN